MSWKFGPLLFLVLLLGACARKAATYEFPRPVDTTTRSITEMRGQAWELPGGGTLDTDFPAARLSRVTFPGRGQIDAWVEPENTPINMSPWYAFRLQSPTARDLEITLNYPGDAAHRYWPKLSTDGENWTWIDSTAFRTTEKDQRAILRVSVPAGRPLYVAAQEIIDVERTLDWVNSLVAQHGFLSQETIGQSRQNRPLVRLRLGKRQTKGKKTIVILSRQHPPEVTGFLAMQAFVESLLEHPELDNFLDDYQVLIYPLLNPDGVDLGHWRHSAGGVDPNRDWAYYRQPENEQIANDIVRTARQDRAPVVLGLDFHSTWEDVYYTHDDSVQPPSVLGNFKDRWLQSIEDKIGGDFHINEEAEPIGRPTTMSWFRTQFNAEGITYEIGDATPREFVERKGRLSAAALVEELGRAKG